jgi:hypothetical protein
MVAHIQPATLTQGFNQNGRTSLIDNEGVPAEAKQSRALA